MFRSLFGKKKDLPSVNTDGVTIKDAVVGDVFTLNGFAVQYDDSYFIIEELNKFTSKAGDWQELLGGENDHKLWLSCSESGGSLYLTASHDDRPVGLSTIGLTDDDLIQLDEEQSIDNYVEVDDSRYYYRTSVEATFFKDGKGNGEGCYVWDFVSEDESSVLTIDKWEGMPFHVRFSEVISPESVTLYKQ